MEGSIKVNIPPVSLKVRTVSIFLRLCDSIAYLQLYGDGACLELYSKELDLVYELAVCYVND